MDEPKAGEENAPPSKLHKKDEKEYIPWVGDWKCTLCGFWSTPYAIQCLGHYLGDGGRTRCPAKQKTHTEAIQEDDGHRPKYVSVELVWD